jgi:hypothetical protein
LQYYFGIYFKKLIIAHHNFKLFFSGFMKFKDEIWFE